LIEAVEFAAFLFCQHPISTQRLQNACGERGVHAFEELQEETRQIE
jgi:hypothetical protein